MFVVHDCAWYTIRLLGHDRMYDRFIFECVGTCLVWLCCQICVYDAVISIFFSMCVCLFVVFPQIFSHSYGDGHPSSNAVIQDSYSK